MEAVSQLDVCVSPMVCVEFAGIACGAFPRRRVVFLVSESSRFCLFSCSPVFRPDGWLLVCGKGLGD